MWHLREPSPDAVRAFLDRQAAEPLSYPSVGATRREPVPAPPGFDLDHNRVRLGEGRAVFEAARAALERWEMFPAPWVRIEPGFRVDAEAGPPPIRQGTVVAVVARALGLWWPSAARVIYTIDETEPLRRFGFAYGTLPGHVERGEKRFSVELRPDGSVWYDILAFSTPRYWLVRLGYPLARRLQRRFVRDSLAAMVRAARPPGPGAGSGPAGPPRP